MTQNNLSGTILGQYELQELIGAGRMGAVYRAYQPSLRRQVAIRLLPPSSYSERFAYLAGIAASLEHPHIVRVYDYGTEQGIDYLAMQLMTGGSLSERLAQRAITELPSMGEISDLLQQLSSALQYAHESGIIHRDINPRNVMFHEGGHVYLTDFGLAELVQEASPITPVYGTGTWAYMSPEQWNGGRLTPATDQYSLAILIYFLIAGRHPFTGATPSAIMFNHLNEMPPPLDNVPDAITAVLEQALEKRPEDRFPTVADFAWAFVDAVGDYTGEPTAFFTAPFERKPAPEIIAAVPRPAPAYPRIPPVERTPLYKSPLLWVAAGAVLVAVLLVLGRRDTSSGSGVTESAAVSLPGTPTATPVDTGAGGITGNDNGANSVVLASPSQAALLPLPSTATDQPSATPMLPTDTAIPTDTAVPPTDTTEPTAIPTILPSNTSAPTATNTPIPPTNTVIPSVTPVPPTNTALPTATSVPPTNTAIPTATSVPPTNTPTPRPSNTPTVPPTNTTIPTVQPSATPMPTNTPLPTATTVPPTPTLTASPSLEPCDMADVNDDQRVDIFDVRAIAARYGTTSTEPTFEAQYDLDQDGVIGILDVQIAVASFGTVCEP